MVIVRRFIVLLVILLLGTGSVFAWEFQVSTSGNTVVVTISGVDPVSCCSGATLDDPTFAGAHCGAPCDGRRIELYCNRPGPHVVYVYAASRTTVGDPYEWKQGTVTVTDPPPFTCPAFEFYSLNSIYGGKVLTHKYRSSDEWPAPGQFSDAQTKLIFRPISIPAGTTMNMKVFDPPDPSTYRTNPQADDNHHWSAGKLAFSPSDGGAKTVSFTVPEHGIVPVWLNTTDFAAGDNYVVKASANPDLLTDPNFVCGAGCRETNTITAWKRVYLEKKRMFRAGGLVVGDALAGTNTVTVQVPRGVRFRPGDPIRLMHAPPLYGTELFRSFYSEDAVITAVDRVPGARDQRLVTLASPLVHSYGEDRTVDNALDRGISDGVGLLAAGFYERNDTYLDGAFSPAFVEYVALPQQITDIPYVPAIRSALDLANKWFEHSPTSVTGTRRGDPNVKHVLGGSGQADVRGIDTGTLGATVISSVFTLEPNASWTYVEAIESAVRDAGSTVHRLDPWKVNGENVVHELAHTWSVNYTTHALDDRGHCTQVMALRPAEACTMSRASEGHNADDIVGFHWVSDFDSEYMTIRRQGEPVPAP